MNTIYHTIFAQIKRYFPEWLSKPIRNIIIAILTPLMFSYRSGHFKSSLRMAAISKLGEPLPWYTYPCIDFIKYRCFRDKIILEFGGGQSTLWWAKYAKRMITFEGDKQWYETIKTAMPSNVDLFLVSMESRERCVSDARNILKTKEYQYFDVVIIDGLFREDVTAIAKQVVAEHGCIICDNAEGYNIYEEFKQSAMRRVDFYGYAPGVLLPHCTSIFFKENCFLFDVEIPIHVIAKE